MERNAAPAAWPRPVRRCLLGVLVSAFPSHGWRCRERWLQGCTPRRTSQRGPPAGPPAGSPGPLGGSVWGEAGGEAACGPKELGVHMVPRRPH